MSASTALAMVFVFIASLTDWKARVVPNSLVLAFGVVGVTFCHSSWSWWGFGLGLGLGFIGALAPGDGKSLGLLGGLLGVEPILAISIITHGTALILLGAFMLRLLPYHGAWPLMPFIAAAVCGTVAAGLAR